ncbi:MAG: hypothetical protein JRG91_13085, partial [Deltaproteobacteria bacterium]|nr:hypothetical protein [Deltaproteobacteria bacterium]
EPPVCLNAPPDHDRFGQPCISEMDCGSGNRCLTESVMVYDGETYVSWLGGTCALWGADEAGCNPDDPTTCPSGTSCVYFGSSGGSDYYGCVDACRSTDTSWNPYDWNCGCREGYRCDMVFEACLPGCMNDRECCEVWEDLDEDYQREDGEVYFDDDCTNWCDGDDEDEYPAVDCMASFACVNMGDPDATWLSPCLFDSDCPVDATCLNEVWYTDPETGDPLYPDGLCRKDACHLIGRGCGVHADLAGDCVNLGTTSDPEYTCTPTCQTSCVDPDSTANPCRHPDRTHPYVCQPYDPTRWFPASAQDGLCLPATVPTTPPGNDMYTGCSEDSDCASPLGLGRCLELMGKAGFCSASCSQNLAETCIICGAAPSTSDMPPGVCALGTCLPSCGTPSGAVGANGCPTGTGLPAFACYPGDGSYGGSVYRDPWSAMPPGFCIPACTTTADCGLLWSGVVSCNTTSGVCG